MSCTCVFVQRIFPCFLACLTALQLIAYTAFVTTRTYSLEAVAVATHNIMLSVDMRCIYPEPCYPANYLLKKKWSSTSRRHCNTLGRQHELQADARVLSAQLSEWEMFVCACSKVVVAVK
ncbi:unnamed protein product [Ceratitis capitata]|uniref:(Mediterranean fruit fly) hypothetical protein n=1 Tax=Ceratitis capitata TaxID=7213 RepID=A0A811V6M8_CERCA|nr:unnamed protein product [Ceratitis capitata]